LFFILLAFYHLHFSCHYCVVTENPEVGARQGDATTCRSSMFVSAEHANDDRAKLDASFYEEVLSEFQRGKPTSPPSEEEDHVERWSQRVMNLRRKDLALEQHDEGINEENINIETRDPKIFLCRPKTSTDHRMAHPGTIFAF